MSVIFCFSNNEIKEIREEMGMSVYDHNIEIKNIEEGSYCNLDDKDHFYIEKYKGCVLQLREWNCPDDSDFYALCWNEEEQCLVRIYYDSTRYASTGNDAFRDATEEIIEKAEKFLIKKERHEKAVKIWEERKSKTETAKISGITRRQVQKLYNSLYNEYTSWKQNDYWNVLNLLKSFNNGKMRSEFRKKLAQQVINWLNDPSPKYNTPLSAKQLECIRSYKEKMGWVQKPCKWSGYSFSSPGYYV